MREAAVAAARAAGLDGRRARVEADDARSPVGRHSLSGQASHPGLWIGAGRRRFSSFFYATFSMGQAFSVWSHRADESNSDIPSELVTRCCEATGSAERRLPDESNSETPSELVTRSCEATSSAELDSLENPFRVLANEDVRGGAGLTVGRRVTAEETGQRSYDGAPSITTAV